MLTRNMHRGHKAAENCGLRLGEWTPGRLCIYIAALLWPHDFANVFQQATLDFEVEHGKY